MSDPLEEADATAPDPQVVNVPTDTPIREIEPLTMFAPNVGDPVATMDFRPHGTFAFKDDAKDHNKDEDDEPLEDGQGNFRHPSQTAPKHPSEPRTPQPYERRGETEEEAAEEPQEAPDTTSPPQGSPLGL